MDIAGTVRIKRQLPTRSGISDIGQMPPASRAPSANGSPLSPDVVCNPDDGGKASLHVLVGGGP